MNIFSFSRMKLFSSEHGKVILKLVFPRLDGFDSFNEFYHQLIACYTDCASALLKSGNAHGRIFVSSWYKHITDISDIKIKRRFIQDELIIIRRFISIRNESTEQRVEYTDIYNLSLREFVG